ncbi:MAG: sensor histidine kinase [Bacteroidales bacterium]
MTNKEYQDSFWSKWVPFLLNPFVISLLATALLVLLLFPTVPKYKLSVTKTLKFSKGPEVYEDLIGDGTSDRITIKDDTTGCFSVVIYENPSGQMNQWNFEGKLLSNSNDCLIIGDFDKNHKKELYIFSLSHDSIMLSCISNLKNDVPEFKNRFIAKAVFRKGNYEATILKAEMDDLSDDGYKELIFGVNSGFSLTPRNIFAYDLRNKKCIASPYLGLSMDRIIQKDITGDGRNEILIQGHGPDNISDTTIKYHDRSTWLMVLDRKLNFLFKPIEFKGAYSHIWPFVFENKKAQNQAGFYVNTTTEPFKSELCLFSSDGEIIETKNLPGIRANGILDVFTIYDKGKPKVVLSERDKHELLVINPELEVDERITGVELFHTAWFDIDKDNQDEIISINNEQDKLVIMRGNLQHPVIINLPLRGGLTPLFSVKENGNEMPELVVWDHASTFFLDYRKNSLYYLRWAIFVGIFFGILLFTWLIRRIQRYQIERKIQIEKKITELQMKIVKNQLDPHFTLNAVNSIIYAVNNNEADRATEHLYHFSNLYRHLLLTADQYKCSLKDELSFTINYLMMEQLRFRDKFNYTISIPDDVNQGIELPKMCIQSAVENAVKHGISPLTAGGEIKISASSLQNRLLIEVVDNGIGRTIAKKNQQSSTYMGIKLMQQYFELFTKITNRKVTSEIIDLKYESGDPAGTKVCISIQIN